MKLEVNQKILQNQKFILTVNMHNSLKILQMPVLDLREYITNEMNENPLLEVDYSEQAYYDDYRRTPNIEDEEKDNPLNYISKEKTLTDYLMEQAGYLSETPEITKAIYYIIQNIDERGYLPLSVQELSSSVNIPLASMSYAISKVQDFEPSGIAASDLKECLLIQLKKRNIKDNNLYKIVEHHLPLVAKNKVADISRKLKISKSDAQKYIEYIKTLEPKPSRGFFENESVYIIPDVFVLNTDGELLVSINDSALPNINLISNYNELIKNTYDAEAKRYIKDRLSSAISIINGLNRRKLTLLRIMENVVIYQHNYFVHGDLYLKQMTLKEIADILELHESTISRAIKDKYVQTPFKTVKIKELFSAGLQADNSNISQTAVKSEILNIVNLESKDKPLTDQEICGILNNKNIDISRRTVAKYRESLGILSSSMRRQIK